MLCPCLFRPCDNVWRSRRADAPRCEDFSTVISPSWITEQISEGKCSHRGALGAPNKFQNCHLDKTTWTKQTCTILTDVGIHFLILLHPPPFSLPWNPCLMYGINQVFPSFWPFLYFLSFSIRPCRRNPTPKPGDFEAGPAGGCNSYPLLTHSTNILLYSFYYLKSGKVPDQPVFIA